MTGPFRQAVRVGFLIAIGMIAAASIARAETPAEFFKGKTVRLIVGTTTGGGYDIYARLLAPYLAKALNNTVIIENRPGGGQMTAMNHVFYQAAPDGLTMMLAPAEGAVLGKLTDAPGTRFDLTKFPILGRVNTAPRALIVNPNTPYKTASDLPKSGKPLVLSAGGKIDAASDTGAVLCHALKLSCKILIGYPSSKEFSLAAIRGESDGTVLVDDSASRFSQDNQLRPVVMTGRERSALMPNVPTVFESTKVDDEGAWWIDFREDLRKLGRLLITTPEIAPDRLAYLQNTVRAVLTNPAIVKEFAAKEQPLQYAPPDEMAKIIAGVLGGSLSQARLDEVRYVINDQYY